MSSAPSGVEPDDRRSLAGPWAVGFSERRLLPLLLLLVGAVSIFLLVWSGRFRQRQEDRDVAALRALSEVQMRAAVSHLWLEELVTGDRVDEAELAGHLERGASLAEALARGRGEAYAAGVPTLEEVDLAEAARAVEDRYLEFRQISEERLRGFALGRQVGIGSALDVQYDAVFERLFASSERLESALEDHLVRSRRNSSRLFAVILTIWATLIIGAAWGLRTWDRRRRAAEAALAESQEQLLQSQKMDAVGRLAGGLAHDINNYLAAIRGHCEIVQMKGWGGEPVARKMEAVMRIVGKTSDLLDRLLTFSRRRPLARRVVRVDRLLTELEDILHSTVGEGIELDLELGRGLRPIWADATQVEQAVVNLVVNAKEAMPSGGRLVVRADNRRLDDGLWVEISVVDQGEGVPPEIADQLFEPFVSSKGAGNSGLGLAVVFGVAEQHGGRIEVESKPGEGAEFRLLLPPTDEADHEPEPIAEARRLTTGGGGAFLLLVDDNEEFREATREMLESRGHRVAVAADGQQALAMLGMGAGEESPQVDLVLLDLVMPGLSGAPLLAELRRTSDARFVLLSGHDETELGRQGIDAAEVEVWSKALSGDGLDERIRRLLPSLG